MAPLRKKLVRHEVPGAARFLTFSCYLRLPLFGNERIKTRFVERLAAVAAERRVTVFAWVVRPEHVHLVLLPNSAGQVTTFLNSLKTSFASEVLKRWKTLDAAILRRVCDAEGGPHFWQHGGGCDRSVIDTELFEKIAYCHRNPIDHGLSTTSVGWPWSSARAYESRPDYVGPPIAFELLPPFDRPLT